jgi:hypothetical protein
MRSDHPTRSDEVGPNETKSHEIRSGFTRSDEVGPNRTKSDEISPPQPDRTRNQGKAVAIVYLFRHMASEHEPASRCITCCVRIHMFFAKDASTHKQTQNSNDCRPAARPANPAEKLKPFALFGVHCECECQRHERLARVAFRKPKP